jgi:hypothetical protein
VKGNQAIKIRNNIGPLSATSLSQIFGPQPSVGSYLELNDSNVFNCYTKGFCINVEWAALPGDPGGWNTYFKAYNRGLGNDSFRVRMSSIIDGKITPADLSYHQEFMLFELADPVLNKLKNSTTFAPVDVKRLNLNAKPRLDKEGLFQNPATAGNVVRMKFSSPQEGFGHRLFPIIFPEAFMHNAKAWFRKRQIPNQPFIPSIRSLSVDYTLEHTEILSVGNADQDFQLFHIYPYGQQEVYPGKKAGQYDLIPDFKYDHNLYIGFSGAVPGEDLSLLFQMETNNYSEISSGKNEVAWSYLADNIWMNLKDYMLVDETDALVRSGVVKFTLPPDIRTGNTILNPNLFWIGVSTSGANAVKSDVIGINAQAVSATRLVLPKPRALGLPAGSITSFKNKIAGILTVSQPYSSFGGRQNENDEAFYTRVSERLRHGNRLVTGRDIEQSVLDAFPDIFMARCIDRGAYQSARSNPTLILIPKETRIEFLLSTQPLVDLSLRQSIDAFIRRSASEFLKVDVKNPVYERIKIVCTLTFDQHPPANTGWTIAGFNEYIKKFLCPWLYNRDAEFKIGKSLYMVDIQLYLEEYPGVKSITDFSVIHFFQRIPAASLGTEQVLDEESENNRVVEYLHDPYTYIQCSSPETVFIPSSHHLIKIAGTGDLVKGVDQIGIGELAVRDELLITEGPVAYKAPKEKERTTKLFNLIIN